jgi:hypothetical protein
MNVVSGGNGIKGKGSEKSSRVKEMEVDQKVERVQKSKVEKGKQKRDM